MCSPATRTFLLRKVSRPLRPTSRYSISAASRSETNLSAPLIRFELKAPAKPLSAVTSTSSTRRSWRCASRGFEATRSSLAAAPATLPRTCRSSAAYGRAAITRSCALRSLAADTIFMAFVICCVFLTLRIRRRMSIRLGMGARRHLRYEPALELLDHALQPGAKLVVKVLLRPDLVEQRAVRVVHEAVQLGFELAALLYRQVVQVSVGAGENDQDLLL